MSQFHRILYCSRSRLQGEADETLKAIQSILAVSRVNNGHQGVSGALLFSDGCFAQVLEGPLDAVEAAFERIQCDERHSDVTVLQSGTVVARDFPDWSMGFAGAAHSAFAGIALSESLDHPSSKGQELVALLKSVVVREDHWLSD